MTRFSSTFAASPKKSGSLSLLVISNPLESDFQKKVILRFFLVFAVARSKFNRAVSRLLAPKEVRPDLLLP